MGQLIAVWPEAVQRVDPDYRGTQNFHTGEHVRLADGRRGKWRGYRYLPDQPPGGAPGYPQHGVCHLVDVDGRSRITNPDAHCELPDITARLVQS